MPAIRKLEFYNQVKKNKNNRHCQNIKIYFLPKLLFVAKRK